MLCFVVLLNVVVNCIFEFIGFGEGPSELTFTEPTDSSVSSGSTTKGTKGTETIEALVNILLEKGNANIFVNNLPFFPPPRA